MWQLPKLFSLVLYLHGVLFYLCCLQVHQWFPLQPKQRCTFVARYSVLASVSKKQEAEFAIINEKYIQREEFVTSIEAHLADMQAQLFASRTDCKTLRAANNSPTKIRDADQKKLLTFRAHDRNLVAEPKAARAPPAELASTVRDRYRYKVLLQSLAAQVQGLLAGYCNIVSRAQGSQDSIRDGLGPLLKEFEPLSHS